MNREEFRRELENIARRADDIVDAHLQKKAEVEHNHLQAVERLRAEQKEEIDILKTYNLSASRSTRIQERKIRGWLVRTTKGHSGMTDSNANLNEPHLPFEEVRERYFKTIRESAGKHGEHSWPTMSSFSPNAELGAFENTVTEDDEISSYGKPFESQRTQDMTSKAEYVLNKRQKKPNQSASRHREFLCDQDQMRELARAANARLEFSSVQDD